jgi:hypothetical protein
MSEREYEMLDLEQVDAILADKECVGVGPSDPEFPIGRILIFSAFVGEDEAKLAELAQLPIKQVFEISAILHRNGVFGKGIDHYKDYFEDEHSGICLNCDIACGKKMLQRGQQDGKASWKMLEEGLKYVEEELLGKKKGRQGGAE